MPDMQPSAELTEQISTDANLTLETSFNDFVKHRRDLVKDRSAAQREFTEALIRTVRQDEQLREAALLESPTLQGVLAALRSNKRGIARRQTSASPATGPQGAMDLVLGPPYANKWKSVQQSGNTFAEADADPLTGKFGFLDIAANGSVACAAGIWVQFVAEPPLFTSDAITLVFPNAPYDFQWNDVSVNFYTAYNNAGLGIYVLSWNMQGNDKRLEQDYRYPVWSDSTGSFEVDQNPSAPDYDYGSTYLPGPPLLVQPYRIYRACFWCFSTIEASGGVFGNALSGAALNVTVDRVVILRI